ncbi:kelch-like protein 24 [Haemaphysalis longicornis]
MNSNGSCSEPSSASETDAADLETCSSGHTPEQHKDVENMDSVLSAMDAFRKDGVLCDVVLCAEGEEFPCHKVVLSSCSSYFKAMFTSQMAEAAQTRVVVNSVKASELRALLDFAYKSIVSITDTNVGPLLSAVDYLQVTRFKDACCRFLEQRLDETNCLSVCQLAETYACVDLEAKAKARACASFEKVMLHGEFLELSKSKLVEFLSLDSLKVANEELLFEGVMTWLKHSPETRTEGFEEIFKHVRLPLISPYYLIDKVSKTPAVLQNLTCCQLLEEAKMFHLLPDRRRELIRPWTAPRSDSFMIEAAVLVGGHDGTWPVRNADCYVPSKRVWLSLAPVPHLVYKHGVTAIGQNSLFFVGGERKMEINTAAWTFNPALNSYCKAAPMICKRRHVSLAALNGFVYAVGGTDSEPSIPSVERYNTVSNQWGLVKAMDTELTTPAVAASLQGKLFVAGVTDLGDNETVGCIQCFDPDSDSWKTLSLSLPPLPYSSPCVFDGKLYLVGGWDLVKQESSPSVVCFDPKTSTWNICKPMEEGRVSPGVTVMANKMFVFGGSQNADDKTQAVDTMEVYDPGTDEWLGRTTMEVKRSWFGCTTLNIPLGMVFR